MFNCSICSSLISSARLVLPDFIILEVIMDEWWYHIHVQAWLHFLQLLGRLSVVEWGARGLRVIISHVMMDCLPSMLLEVRPKSSRSLPWNETFLMDELPQSRLWNVFVPKFHVHSEYPKIFQKGATSTKWEPFLISLAFCCAERCLRG